MLTARLTLWHFVDICGAHTPHSQCVVFVRAKKKTTPILTIGTYQRHPDEGGGLAIPDQVSKLTYL